MLLAPSKNGEQETPTPLKPTRRASGSEGGSLSGGPSTPQPESKTPTPAACRTLSVRARESRFELGFSPNSGWYVDIPDANSGEIPAKSAFSAAVRAKSDRLLADPPYWRRCRVPHHEIRVHHAEDEDHGSRVPRLPSPLAPTTLRTVRKATPSDGPSMPTKFEFPV
jgi:hypothetical protein